MYNLVLPIIESLWGVTLAEATPEIAQAITLGAHISMWLLYALLIVILCGLVKFVASPFTR